METIGRLADARAMTQIDLGSLLLPISDDSPCGSNLEYDSSFGELERVAQGTPERVMGDQIIPAEEPDWQDVRELSLSLLQRTKDLRVAVQLLHAALKTGGLPVFADGVTLIRRFLEDFWDSVHPQLDKDDGDDPTLRMNSLLVLNDRSGVVASLSRCPLVSSRALGRISLRDVRVASGEIAAQNDDEAARVDSALISAAFLDGDFDELQSNAQAVETALAELKAINAHLLDKVGSRAPELGALSSELTAARRVLAEQIGRRTGTPVDETASAGAAEGVPSSVPGEIRSREDVIRAIDRICDYFQRHEPSSPVPLLLRRAKRLVAKDFIEILRDLTPDGVAQAELIGGLDRE
jgi:type VI secretion system protein ImpA